MSNIISLLLPTVFSNDFIHITATFQHFHSMLKRHYSSFAFFLKVKFICRDRNYQLIAKRFCPAEQVYMTNMEQIKSAIGDNCFHRDSLRILECSYLLSA